MDLPSLLERKYDLNALKGSDTEFLNSIAKDLYNQVYSDVIDKSTKSIKQKKIEMLFDSFLYLVECGLDINTIERKHYLDVHTWWYSLIRLAELTVKNEKSYKKRFEYIKVCLEKFSHCNLITSPVYGRCLTGWACISESWGVAGNLLEIDDYIENSVPNIYSDAVVESKQFARINLGLEFMDSIWERYKKIDEESNQTLDFDGYKEVVRRYLGCSPLIIASAFTNVEQVSWLISKGADVNCTDVLAGASPIFHVLNKKLGVGNDGNRKRAKETLDLLFENGANINLLPKTGEDFWRQLVNSKSLKGEDREYYKKYYKEHKEIKTNNTPSEKKKLFSLGELITPRDIRKLDSQTDFLSFPNIDLLIVLISYLFEKGIKEFSSFDICTIISQEWSGVNSGIYTGLDGIHRSSCFRELKEANIVEVLGRIMVKKESTFLANKDVHISRDNGRDIYLIFGNVFDPNVVDTQ